MNGRPRRFVRAVFARIAISDQGPSARGGIGLALAVLGAARATGAVATPTSRITAGEALSYG